MKFLIDTHAFLWAVNDNPLLSRSAYDAIEDAENEIVLSMASLWEIAIKLSIGKLKIELPFLDLSIHAQAAHGVELLQIAPRHLDLVSRLHLHHRDPFDRLLVAQCHVEEIALISRDETFDRYGVDRLW